MVEKTAPPAAAATGRSPTSQGDPPAGDAGRPSDPPAATTAAPPGQDARPAGDATPSVVPPLPSAPAPVQQDIPVPGPQAPPPPQVTAPAVKPAAETSLVKLPPETEAAVKLANGLSGRLEALEKTIERVKDRDADLAAEAPNVEAIAADALRAAEALGPKLADVRSQVDKLGAAPAADAPPEAAGIAAERTRLNGFAAEIDGAIKSANLVQVRARQLAGRIQALRQSIFTRDLLRRSPSPLQPSIWVDVGTALPVMSRQVSAIAADWVSAARAQWPALASIAALAFAAYWLLKITIRRALRQRLAFDPEYPPGFFRKASAAFIAGPARAAPSVVSVGLAYGLTDAMGLLYLQVGEIVGAAVLAFVGYKIAGSLTKAYLQPQRPAWRLMAVDDATARRLTSIVKSIAALYGIDLLLREVIRVLFLPLSVSIALTFLTSMAFAALLLVLVRTPLPTHVGRVTALSLIRTEVVKAPLLIAAIAIVLASLTGYIALARYVAGQVVATGGALLVLVMLYLASRAIASETPEALAAKSGTDPVLGLSPDQRRFLSRGISILLDVALVLVAAPVLLYSFGFAPAEIASLTNRALFGFELGGFQISLARIAAAVLIFAGIIVFTRMLQRWIVETVLPPQHADQGLSNSIGTGILYIGYGIAALAAISYTGLDITNLAIVAGALSVGIGFGLQSIVNNFVSGLILLVERPVKVGDWIRVGSNEGYVRRISVRSTEIETFDRASVILPNSELITGTVVNMTHRNAIGRLTIPVGVAYDSDPRKVEEILLAAAQATPLVARHPAPFVVFERFGDSALDFSLRVYLADVNRSLAAKSQLLTEILLGFRAAGIEIPYPQRDFNLRGLEGLREALGLPSQPPTVRPDTAPPHEDVSDAPAPKAT
ncbi:MAG: DUF3772 domain-containing protein [Hyphomicrobiaceae bacterium]|nr:DUF3772 domain-containing protein [Hyphomicrobiaceae bacterium]